MMERSYVLQPTFAKSHGVQTFVLGKKIWRRGSESNRRMQLLQSRALPLGYPAAPSKGY